MRKPKQQLKVFLLIGLLWMSCGVLIAQNPLVKQWDKRFGGTGEEVISSFQQTIDAGYIAGGYTLSGNSGDITQPSWGGYDFWIVKTDSLGNKQWDKRLGGSGQEVLHSMQQTTDQGYIAGGSSSSGISGDKSQNSRGLKDYWIVKLDALGNKEWDKRYGGPNEDILLSLQQTSDGGYILAGLSMSDSCTDKSEMSRGVEDYWVIKIDSNGNKQWDKTFGGADQEWPYSVHQTSDGGYILGGFSTSGFGGDKTQLGWGNQEFWIVKIDSIGNKQWDKDFGGIGHDFLSSVCQTFDGGYILGGPSDSDISGDKTQPSWGNKDYWIIKVDSLGNKLWDKDYGGIDDEDSWVYLIQTSDSGYMIGGKSHSNISGNKTENNLGNYQTWIVKIDALGNLEWDKTLRTTDANINNYIQGSFPIQTNDGGYAIGSYVTGGIGGDKTEPNWNSTNSTHDYWIIKFLVTIKPLANLISTDTSFCEKHCIDFYDLSTNNPSSWQWFFPGADSSTSSLQNPTNICYSTYGSFDVTLIACNAAGCDTLYLPGFINEYQTLTPVITQSNDTLFSSPGMAYQWWSVDSGIIAGATNNYFIPTTGGNYYVIVTDTVGCAGSSNVITVSFTGINQWSIVNGQLSIIPNPNDGSFTISINEFLHKDLSVSVFNSLGQKLNIPIAIGSQWSMVNGQKATVSLGNVPKGVYTVEVTGDKVYRARLVIQ